MNKDDAFINLTIALQYDSYGEKYLTDFDRMFIQKKRSALINDKDYELPTKLSEKIVLKLKFIEQTKWESPY